MHGHLTRRSRPQEGERIQRVPEARLADKAVRAPMRRRHRYSARANGGPSRRRLSVNALLLGFACLVSNNSGAAEKPEPGFTVTFAALDGKKATATDVTVSPNVWLYVPAGQPPTPFLSGGRFSAD